MVSRGGGVVASVNDDAALKDQGTLNARLLAIEALIQAASLACKTQSAVLWFQSEHLAQGLRAGSIIYQSQWCFQARSHSASRPDPNPSPT